MVFLDLYAIYYSLPHNLTLFRTSRKVDRAVIQKYRLQNESYIHLNIKFMLCYIGSFGGGNGTPLQYSCLENPMDGGAW